jgi:hypothetical protein
MRKTTTEGSMPDRIAKIAALGTLIATAHLSSVNTAHAFATWEGVALIESTTGTACATNDLGVGKTLRMFFKPRTVGGNSTGSEMLFVYERGAFTIRKSNGDLTGSSNFDAGTAVFFNLHNAGSFVFVFQRNAGSNAFDLNMTPATLTDTTANVRITGTITFFFGLFTVATSNCDVTIRANLLKQP